MRGMLSTPPPCRSILAFAALALGCAERPPPASPADAETTVTPADEPEAVSAPMPAPDEAPAPSEPSGAAATTGEASRTPPKDARGRSEIQQVMASNRDAVRACYDAALAQNPGIHGDLVVSFVIDPRGNVKQAEVNWAESDIHVPELDTCAIEAVTAIKFPPSSRGMESKVTYPFNFNPPRSEPKPSEPKPGR